VSNEVFLRLIDFGSTAIPQRTIDRLKQWLHRIIPILPGVAACSFVVFVWQIPRRELLREGAIRVQEEVRSAARQVEVWIRSFMVSIQQRKDIVLRPGTAAFSVENFQQFGSKFRTQGIEILRSIECAT
jgi:hypothetical protein